MKYRLDDTPTLRLEPDALGNVFVTINGIRVVAFSVLGEMYRCVLDRGEQQTLRSLGFNPGPTNIDKNSRLVDTSASIEELKMIGDNI